MRVPQGHVAAAELVGDELAPREVRGREIEPVGGQHAVAAEEHVTEEKRSDGTVQNGGDAAFDVLSPARGRHVAARYPLESPGVNADGAKSDFFGWRGAYLRVLQAFT